MKETLMIREIATLIVKESENATGQDAAARIHSVLMDVRQAVGQIIAEEQLKEREIKKSTLPENSNTC
jgi:hypothetical protein